MKVQCISVQFSSVAQSCPTLPNSWTAAHQVSLSITNSQSLPKLMSIESVMPSNYLILCCPLLLLPSIFPSIRVFSNMVETANELLNPEATWDLHCLRITKRLVWGFKVEPSGCAHFVLFLEKPFQNMQPFLVCVFFFFFFNIYIQVLFCYTGSCLIHT